MPNQLTTYFASLVWLNGQWSKNVLLTVNAKGDWHHIDTQPSIKAQANAITLHGPVIPSLINAHSHAFQRAFAGMAETRHQDADHFWSWRDRMYAVANLITPAQLKSIASQLYMELLCGGYTHVCEFHYLHHSQSGKPYDDPYTMSKALIEAAQDVGIGLTLLPVLYERAGFTSPQLRLDQRRFSSSPEFVLNLCHEVNQSGFSHINAGVALHSLRAVTPNSLTHTIKNLNNHDVPIHIHISEQIAEVNECVLQTGLRPVQWLAQNGMLDSRWHLVHATHTSDQEIEAVAKSKAGWVVCPSTEANLGDGFTHVSKWLDLGINTSIGSDSHVSRNWKEELRWLEYGQRLHVQNRNVCANPNAGVPDTAHRIFNAAVDGSASPAGLRSHGFIVGARADFIVLNTKEPGLLGVPSLHTLNALLFACDSSAIDQVYVAGNLKINQNQHIKQQQFNHAYVDAMNELFVPE